MLMKKIELHWQILIAFILAILFGLLTLNVDAKYRDTLNNFFNSKF